METALPHSTKLVRTSVARAHCESTHSRPASALHPFLFALPQPLRHAYNAIHKLTVLFI